MLNNFYYKNALKYENALSTFYDNYQMALNKVKNIRLASEKDKKLQSRFIQGKMQVYQKHYPPFRVLKAVITFFF